MLLVLTRKCITYNLFIESSFKVLKLYRDHQLHVEKIHLKHLISERIFYFFEIQALLKTWIYEESILIFWLASLTKRSFFPLLPF